MEGGEFRSWDELLPDALGLIFKKLSLQDILTVIPRVCKSWGNVVAGPYCWQEINIEDWSRLQSQDKINRMVEMLVTRSCGSVRKLGVTGLSSERMLSFIANHARNLQTLRLPSSQLSSPLVEQVAAKLTSITFLDLSHCEKISGPALEVIGKNCKLLSGLRRVMRPLEVVDKDSQDDEAHAIATTMPKMKYLEMAYLVLSTGAVLEIISNCKDLEYIDLRGCWDVKLDEKVLKERHPKLEVVGPVVDEGSCWDMDDCSYYSDSSDYLAWDFVAGGIADYDDLSSDGWDDEQRLEELEMRFYEGVNQDIWDHSIF
ncbi:hypothetical protein MKW92_011496 [Papaver armeniacum]|nr:hypothetical protein MKW92_011496 [Papaver armeniacum]